MVYCSKSDSSLPDGSARLLAADGSPSLDGKGRPEIYMNGAWLPICNNGISAGAAGVICKSMGYSGAIGAATKCDAAGENSCGSVAPGLSEVACSGAEADVLKCPHEAGDDVFCAPSESILVACAGDGDAQGRPAKEAAPQAIM